MKIDWPFAIGLAVMFVAISYARWRWFKARFLNRPSAPPPQPPPVE